MREAEGVNFKVGLMNNNELVQKDIRKSQGKNLRGPNLDEIIVSINKLPASDTEKKFLIDKAKKTPHGALKSFCQNYKNYLKNSK